MSQRTQLFSYHEKHGHLVDFAGFLMPVWYTGINQEALAVRKGCGVFDVSHMGRLWIRGGGAERYLNYIATNNVSNLKPGSGQYSLLCNENGGIIDDVIISRIDRDFFIVVFNASNREKDLAWFSRYEKDFDVSLEDVSEKVALIAVQGPRAAGLIQELSENDISGIPRFGCAFAKLDGLDCLASRTGYTGEDGFEIHILNTTSEHPEPARRTWDRLLELGRKWNTLPCGLGARDVLRLEAGMCLYGNDIDETTSPLEAGLRPFVKFEKPEFVGKDALLGKTPDRLRIGMQLLERGIPRSGYEVFSQDLQVGRVTSGTLSPLLAPIAMGYVKLGYEQPGSTLKVKIREKYVSASVTRLPFYKRVSESRVMVFGEEKDASRFFSAATT